MKRSYELLVVFRPDVEVTDKTAAGLVSKLVGEKVTVDSVTILGKKTLAYEIKHQKEGLYVLAMLSGSIIVSDIEKRVQLGSEVLRFLLTQK
jgi:ribosomal protein S6